MDCSPADGCCEPAYPRGTSRAISPRDAFYPRQHTKQEAKLTTVSFKFYVAFEFKGSNERKFLEYFLLLVSTLRSYV